MIVDGDGDDAAVQHAGFAPVVHAPGAGRVAAGASGQAPAVALRAELGFVAVQLDFAKPCAVRRLEALASARALRAAAAALRRHVERAGHARREVPHGRAVLELHQVCRGEARRRRVGPSLAVHVHHAHVGAVRRALRPRRRQQQRGGVAAAAARLLLRGIRRSRQRQRGARRGQRHARPQPQAQRVAAGGHPGGIRPSGQRAHAHLQHQRHVDESRGGGGGQRVGRRRPGVEADAALPRRRARHAAAQRAVQSVALRRRDAVAAEAATQRGCEQQRRQMRARHGGTGATWRSSARGDASRRRELPLRGRGRDGGALCCQRRC